MDGQTYTYSEPFTVNSNKTITARSILKNITKDTQKEITNIDNTPPELSISMDNATAVAAGKMRDTQSGVSKFRWVFNGSNAAGTINYDGGWVTNNISGTGYITTSVGGLDAVGTLTFYAQDALGNEGSTSYYVNNKDTSVPTLSLVSTQVNGITNCPHCGLSSGKVTVTVSFNDIGSGFGGTAVNQYMDVNDTDSSGAVTGHAICTQAPDQKATSGNITFIIYSHGQTAGSSTKITVSFSDAYGNPTNTLEVPVTF